MSARRLSEPQKQVLLKLRDRTLIEQSGFFRWWCSYDRPPSSRTVLTLMDWGLVAKEPISNDPPSNEIVLTDAGACYLDMLDAAPGAPKKEEGA